MKFQVHLRTGPVISLSDVDDFVFDKEDHTAVFYHDDTTLSIIPRESIVLVKEIPEEVEEKPTIN